MAKRNKTQVRQRPSIMTRFMERWALGRFIVRWAARYKRLFLWLPAPLRIVLVVTSVIAAALLAVVVYVLAVFMIWFVVLFIGMAIFSGRRRDIGELFGGDDDWSTEEYAYDDDDGKKTSVWDDWRRDNEEYMQDLHDANQREQEDKGR